MVTTSRYGAVLAAGIATSWLGLACVVTPKCDNAPRVPVCAIQCAMLPFELDISIGLHCDRVLKSRPIAMCPACCFCTGGKVWCCRRSCVPSPERKCQRRRFFFLVKIDALYVLAFCTDCSSYTFWVQPIDVPYRQHCHGTFDKLREAAESRSFACLKL